LVNKVFEFECRTLPLLESDDLEQINNYILNH
jgi:hypothetical protein